MTQIQDIIARQIFDSRGRPTVEVDVRLECGAFGRASVPSGASTGTFEAHELRDGNKDVYHGLSVLNAVEHVNGEIFSTLSGMYADEQRNIDRVLCELDGTENKSRLGANSILAVSLAVAKASAEANALPLFQYLGGNLVNALPTPFFNVINGGAHADNGLDIQEFMLSPLSAASFEEAMQMGMEVFHTLKKELSAKGFNTNVGDEGGFAPNLRTSGETLELLMRSIEAAGYVPGEDIGIGLDVAASEFYKDGLYHIEGQKLSSGDMILYYDNLLKSFPIVSIEDALHEEDWKGWKELTAALDDKVQLVGDDLFVTNPMRLEKGIAEHCANAILIKPNQIGTLTETIDTIRFAKDYGYACMMSHRSGETEDCTISHLAVAAQTSQIKAGSLSRTDRLCKYNELLRIEEFLGDDAALYNPFG